MSHQIFVDFDVRSTLTHLIVTDLSDWKHIEDKPSIIEITLPGHKSLVTMYFDKYKVNKYNSIDLGLNCYDECDSPNTLSLPDGIYKIAVKGSPSSFNKEYFYLKTDKFDVEFAKLYASSYKSAHKNSYQDKLFEIFGLKIGAESCMEIGEVHTASDHFSKAISIVDKLKNCEDCNVWMQ